MQESHLFLHSLLPLLHLLLHMLFHIYHFVCFLYYLQVSFRLLLEVMHLLLKLHLLHRIAGSPYIFICYCSVYCHINLFYTGLFPLNTFLLFFLFLLFHNNLLKCIHFLFRFYIHFHLFLMYILEYAMLNFLLHMT